MSIVTDRHASSSSRSPSRRTLGDKISALGAKLSRTLSHADESHEDEEGKYGKGRDSVDSGSTATAPILYQERSLSRGRDAFQSTGRGGLGNIRQASQSRDARPETGPDDFSVTRGREALASPNQVFSTGRGGAGNLHSPSRDASSVRPTPDAAEQEVIREYVAEHASAPFSSGRGGIGNINRSRSRDPASTVRTSISPGPAAAAHHTTTHVSHAVHSTGRGGAGNIYPGDGVQADVIDEEARRRVAGGGLDAYHSTGRGGLANISSAHEPAVERHPHDIPEYESTGRGGVGNIVHESGKERSKSRGRA